MTHQFDTEIAEKYGIEAAILLNHIQFWILKNKAAQRNSHDGKYWTYMSISGFVELFPYMKEKTIRRVIKELIDANIIAVGNYNENTYDRTLWYSIVDEINVQKEQMHLLETANGFARKGKSHISTDNNTDNNSDLFFPTWLSEKFESVILDWMAYKKEKKQTYKPMGFNKFCQLLKEYSNHDPLVAKKIIDRSIANNWSGIFPIEKEKSSAKKESPNRLSNNAQTEELKNQF